MPFPIMSKTGFILYTMEKYVQQQQYHYRLYYHTKIVRRIQISVGLQYRPTLKILNEGLRQISIIVQIMRSITIERQPHLRMNTLNTAVYNL